MKLHAAAMKAVATKGKMGLRRQESGRDAPARTMTQDAQLHQPGRRGRRVHMRGAFNMTKRIREYIRRSRSRCRSLPSRRSLAPATRAADPPTRVARLSYVGGAVSFSPAGDDQWAQAVLNRPLVTGDRLWSDRRRTRRARIRQRSGLARRCDEPRRVEHG